MSLKTVKSTSMELTAVEGLAATWLYMSLLPWMGMRTRPFASERPGWM